MNWNEEWVAEDGQQREQGAGRQGWLGQMSTLDNAMHTKTFEIVEKWVQKTLGITGLRGYVGASTLLVPADREPTRTSEEATTVGRYAAHLVYVSWLPSFEKLELKNESTDVWDEDAPGKAVLVSNKSQIFVFQAKLFSIRRTKSSKGCDILNVRVFWGSTKLIYALLAEVTENVTLEAEAPLRITTVWHDGMDQDEAVKRPLSLIDMEPETKTWLLNDLKTFFAKDSMSCYRMSGSPYRRGYLLYGPPGTGKTSLAQAIASDYDLELFEIKLGRMTDSTLQATFKNLPPRCVVLFEDIDAAGIGREDLIKADAESKEAMKQVNIRHAKGNYDSADDNENFEADPELYCRKHDIDLPQKQSFVTLSGLLNTPDGPGAKEGRFVIMTTNSPSTLDKAMIRKGRIGKRLYLGYSCPASAECTFKRMFGTDLTFHIPTKDLERLAKRFARRIPKDLFTPCEISDYCRNYRGQPREAIKQFRKFAEDRIDGKDEFQYDIKDSEQEDTVPDQDGEESDAKKKKKKKKKLFLGLPADSSSEGEDAAYAILKDANVSQPEGTKSHASTTMKVAKSPDGTLSASEENLAETLEESQGEEHWMFEHGYFSPAETFRSLW